MHNDTVLPQYGPKYIIGSLASTRAKKESASAHAPSEAKPWPPTPDVRPGSTQTWTSGGTSEELPRERAKSTFDVEKLTNVMDGGAHYVACVERLPLCFVL